MLCNDTTLFLKFSEINKKETITLAAKLYGMLQRIQTLYLFLSALCTGALPFVFPLLTIDASSYFAQDHPVYLGLFAASTLITGWTIFKYKTRQTQFVLGRINIIVNLILLGLFVYRLLNLSGEFQNSQNGIGLFLPVVSVVLLVLANKAIKKDEALIKSIDRLR